MKFNIHSLFSKILFWRPQAEKWSATHKHAKGGLYRVVAEGLNEKDRLPVVIYDDVDEQVWVRPSSEFGDGRFAPLDPDDAV